MSKTFSKLKTFPFFTCSCISQIVAYTPTSQPLFSTVPQRISSTSTFARNYFSFAEIHNNNFLVSSYFQTRGSETIFKRYSSLTTARQLSRGVSPSLYQFPLEMKLTEGATSAPSTLPRRSSRIRKRATSSTISTITLPLSSSNNINENERISTPKIKRKRRTKSNPSSSSDSQIEAKHLPRTRELQLIQKQKVQSIKKMEEIEDESPQMVMGIDEAGRGPIAGPVVAAAAIIPSNIPGIIDSKKITKEEERERLFECIVSSPEAIWAASIVDAKRIDEINILQATMEAMSNAAKAIISMNVSEDSSSRSMLGKEKKEDASPPRLDNRDGCYIISSASVISPSKQTKDQSCNSDEMSHESHTKTTSIETSLQNTHFYALIDGNRVPSTMPCPSEPIVKGDSKEYCIAAASIIAKVIRDRIMNDYHDSYPKYNLKKHKGYPTAAHMDAVKQFGASPIHRRTFAPLKHMNLDDDGKILS